jgi:hypothetical protein
MTKTLIALAMAASLAGAASAATRPLTTQDYLDIKQLNARYVLATDTGDGPGRAATFTADGGFIGVRTMTPEPVSSLAERTTRTGNTGQRHLMMNEIITATPEGADMTCYALILQPQNKERQPAVGIVVIYNDKLVRTPQGWRFKSRKVWADSDPASPYYATSVQPPPRTP